MGSTCVTANTWSERHRARHFDSLSVHPNDSPPKEAPAVTGRTSSGTRLARLESFRQHECVESCGRCSQGRRTARVLNSVAPCEPQRRIHRMNASRQCRGETRCLASDCFHFVNERVCLGLIRATGKDQWTPRRARFTAVLRPMPRLPPL